MINRKDSPFYLNPELKSHINVETGEITDHEGCKKSEKAALVIGERLLGSTLVTNEKLYIISMVELYYGGIGDDRHDWYRKNIISKGKSHGWKNAGKIEAEGLCFYSKLDKSSNWNRIDIVVGPAEVPVSFLLRNLITCDKKPLISRKSGGPGLTARELYSEALLLYPKIHFEPSEEVKVKHFLFDTHEVFFNKNHMDNSDIKRKKRCINNKFDGLPGKYNNEFMEKPWNLSIHAPSFEFPDEIKHIQKQWNLK